MECRKCKGRMIRDPGELGIGKTVIWECLRCEDTEIVVDGIREPDPNEKCSG